VEQFDFALRPELKRSVMLRYFDSTFVAQAGTLILVGPSGVGKTHLAIALGTRMVQLGYRVRFLTAQQFANAVLAAANRTALASVLHPLIQCDLLILDEFGYLPVEPQIGPALYELIRPRYPYCAVPRSLHPIPVWGRRRVTAAARVLLVLAIVRRLPLAAQLPPPPVAPRLPKGRPLRWLPAAPASLAGMAPHSVSVAARSGGDTPTNTDTRAASALSAPS
jgi:hypothetical protein